MKDFYEAQREEFAGVKRHFTFAGVYFEIKPLMPGDALADVGELGGPNADNAWDVLTSAVRRSLLPEYRSRWNDLLAEEREVPITVDVLSALVEAMVEEQKALSEEKTGRPTQVPSPSSTSRESTQTRSTENSDSQEDKASIISRSVPV